MKSTKESLDLTIDELTTSELRVKEFLNKVLSENGSVVEAANEYDFLEESIYRGLEMNVWYKDSELEPMPHKVLAWGSLTSALTEILEYTYENVIGGGNELLYEDSFMRIARWLSLDYVDEFSESESWKDLYKRTEEDFNLVETE